MLSEREWATDAYHRGGSNSGDTGKRPVETKLHCWIMEPTVKALLRWRFLKSNITTCLFKTHYSKLMVVDRNLLPVSVEKL